MSDQTATHTQAEIKEYELICEAEELIYQAIEKLEEAARGSDHADWARAYIINGMHAMVNSWNRYDQDLQSWKFNLGFEAQDEE